MRDNYFQSKEFRQMLQRYEAHAKVDNSLVEFNSWELTDLAEWYVEQGLVRNAYQVVQRGLSIYPTAVGLNIFMARYTLGQGRPWVEAELWLNQVEEQSDPEFIVGKAEVYLMGNKTEEAQAYMLEHQSLADDEDEYALDMAYLMAQYEQMHYAEEWLQKCHLTDSPDYREVQALLAMHKHNNVESQRLFNALIDEDPYSQDYWVKLASSQVDSGQLEESINSCNFALAIAPHHWSALMQKARALFMLERYEEALPLLYKVHALQRDSRVVLMLVNIFMVQQRYDVAIAVLLHQTQQFEAFPVEQAQFITQLIYLYVDVDEEARALHWADRLSLLKGRDKAEEYQNEAFALKGYIYLCFEREDKAVECMRQYMEKVDDDSAPLRIAHIYYEAHRWETALGILEVVASTFDEEYMVNEWPIMAHMALLLHRPQQYMQYLEKACRLYPSYTCHLLSEYFPKGFTAEQIWEWAQKHPMPEWSDEENEASHRLGSDIDVLPDDTPD